MQLNNLVKITKREEKRLGLGHGSGRGKTAGRGTKGQKARNKVPIYFEGGALPLIKRIPFKRGKGRNNAFKPTPFVVNVSLLNQFTKNTVIDIKALVDKRIVPLEQAKKDGVKILGDGELTVSLTVKLPVSKIALEKIEKAGGKVEDQEK